ncbi:unnamed protein product [Closterium sp. NIES-54]
MVAIQNSQKYDRQLRIWGEHGQRALEQARVCLLTAGPTGTEALKNLVLGGIGSFTVVDGATVEAHDLGNNYFLDRTHLGTSRAQAVTALLQELNESVAARFVEESPATLVENNAKFFSEFTLVIATQLPESVLMQLDSVCRQHGCQLIVARSYGLMGLVRISAPVSFLRCSASVSLTCLLWMSPWCSGHGSAAIGGCATSIPALALVCTAFAWVCTAFAWECWRATHQRWLKWQAIFLADFAQGLALKRFLAAAVTSSFRNAVVGGVFAP